MAIHRSRVAVSAAALCAALSFFAPRVFADEGPKGSEETSIEEQIKAQVRKIVKLMRENETALLQASLGSGKKPDGPDVKPPEAAATPPLKGEDARRRLDELVKASQGSSAAIPKEIEELLRMIPC